MSVDVLGSPIASAISDSYHITPATFVGGNLVTSLHEGRWVVRLPDEERAELLALPGAKPFEPMPGRAMTGYACLPPSVVDDDVALDRWVGRALAFGGTLPLKR